MKKIKMNKSLVITLSLIVLSLLSLFLPYLRTVNSNSYKLTVENGFQFLFTNPLQYLVWWILIVAYVFTLLWQLRVSVVVAIFVFAYNLYLIYLPFSGVPTNAYQTLARNVLMVGYYMNGVMLILLGISLIVLSLGRVDKKVRAL
jgi:hypothetical protein